LRQRTANGDLSDAEPCDGNAAILCLEGDVGSVVTDKSGTPFGSFIRHDTYAQLNATRSVTTGYGASIELLDNARIGRFENHLALGVSWDGSRSRFSAESEIGALTEDRGFGDPHGIIDMADGPIRSVDVVSHRSDLGIFVSDMFSPTSRLDVTVSARYNRSRVRLADQIGEDLNGDHVYQRLNPAVGASWHIARGVSLYGGYSESNRAPTPAELSCANPEAPCSLSAFFVNDPDLDPVVAHTWEAGVRGREDLGRGISIAWRVGGWRSTNSNDIIFTASQAVGRAYFRNVGETRRQGIEAEAQVEAKRWSARISYVLTDATYRTAFAANSPDNPGADDGGLIDVLPGDRIPGIPRHRLKASVTRKLGEVAWVALDGQYSGRRWLLGDEANLTFPTKGYFLANLSAGIRPFKGIELFGEIDNLANRKYATFGGFTQTDEVNFQEAPGIANSRALAPGAPRTWVFGARASF
jgi:outer membrane receptor protein involved in Fe transport